MHTAIFLTLTFFGAVAFIVVKLVTIETKVYNVSSRNLIQGIRTLGNQSGSVGNQGLVGGSQQADLAAAALASELGEAWERSCDEALSSYHGFQAVKLPVVKS